jgi:hypothetical protein
MNDALRILNERFLANPDRHASLDWSTVLAYMDTHPRVLDTLERMEDSGGEPDIIQYQGTWILVDLANESPLGRRSLCYDKDARVNRKKVPPASSAWEQAHEMGVQLVDEGMYHTLQQITPLDTKTSSWLDTPEAIRARGGALFGDCRYGRSFVYHNGADSYYGARGFRGYVRLFDAS